MKKEHEVEMKIKHHKFVKLFYLTVYVYIIFKTAKNKGTKEDGF